MVREEGPAIRLLDADGKQRLTLEVVGRGPRLVLSGTDEIVRAALAESPDGPWPLLEDTIGLKAEMGSSSLLNRETGETHKTSIASITWCGKDGKVI
jgi:hypothetical protein